jgi:hypothetical protein
MPDHDDERTKTNWRLPLVWSGIARPPQMQTTDWEGASTTPLTQQTVTSAPPGCICPPGANLTCQAPDCPRKPLPVGGAR